MPVRSQALFFSVIEALQKKSEHTEADQGMLVTVYGRYKISGGVYSGIYR